MIIFENIFYLIFIIYSLLLLLKSNKKGMKNKVNRVLIIIFTSLFVHATFWCLTTFYGKNFKYLNIYIFLKYNNTFIYI